MKKIPVKGMTVIASDRPPTIPSRLVDEFSGPLILSGEHELCPGCGEPAAIRSVVEVIDELEMTPHAIGVIGIGCYTAFSFGLDIEVLQALHGRAPSLATGVKRARPDTMVVSIQGDGDMVNEGLQELLHTAARGENVTAVLLNNGVFGETGGQMTSTTAIGQRTKTSVEGRDPHRHGFPIQMAELVSCLQGATYVARGATNNAANVSRTRRMLRRALEVQAADGGFSFVEILTMCPTGWFIETQDAPAYLRDNLSPQQALGVIKDLAAGNPSEVAVPVGGPVGA